MSLGFYFDMTRCSGCAACRTACQDRFDLFEVVTERPGSNVVTRWAHLAGAYDTGDLDVFI